MNADATLTSDNPFEQDVKELKKAAARGKFQDTARGEFEALAKNIEAIREAYKKAYGDDQAGLLRDWTDQHARIERLRRSIEGSYPDSEGKPASWKVLIKDMVCPIRNSIAEYEKTIEEKVKPAKGDKEKTRDEKKLARDAAKERLDAWSKIVERLKKQLTDNKTEIEHIEKLMPGPDQILSVYYFWFKLLPGHWAIAPDGETAPADETPQALCRPKEAETGTSTSTYQSKEDEKKEGGGSPSATAAPSGTGARSGLPTPPRQAPWLIDPATLVQKIEQAAAAWKRAGEEASDAEIEFQTNPDDLATLKGNLDKRKKEQVAEIEKALRNKENPRQAQRAA